MNAGMKELFDNNSQKTRFIYAPFSFLVKHQVMENTGIFFAYSEHIVNASDELGNNKKDQKWQS